MSGDPPAANTSEHLRKNVSKPLGWGEHPQTAGRIADVAECMDVSARSITDPTGPELCPFSVGKKAETTLQDQKQLILVVMHVRRRPAAGWDKRKPDGQASGGLSPAKLDLDHVTKRLERLTLATLHDRWSCRIARFRLVHEVFLSFDLHLIDVMGLCHINNHQTPELAPPKRSSLPAYVRRYLEGQNPLPSQASDTLLAVE